MQNETSSQPPGGIDYVAFEESADFKELKKRQRSFVFPLSLFFLVWYGTYIVVAAYAHDFMATPSSATSTWGCCSASVSS